MQKNKNRNTNKLEINWQNFSQVGFQLKFAFRIRPSIKYNWCWCQFWCL